MQTIRLKNITDNYFQSAWELYEEAFPVEERRSLDAQTKVMTNDNYHFEVIIDGNKLIGFLFWWNLETFRYIDHFATSVAIRNQGLGKLILQQFMATNNKPILLEVELPETTINQRRIKFYERLGFILNPHYYEVPSAEENQAPLQLLLMSSPKAISEQEVNQFVNTCHPIIFKD